MLKHLRIQNFAIIDAVEISFGEGLNIISGETGAGKSIIMDALFLILGGRASQDLIRKGAEEAVVEALFEVDGDKILENKLKNFGIALDDGDLIVRRVVQASGKNRIFVNGSLVNTSTLAEITSALVDLCSQHDQQLLVRNEEQLSWVDRFAGLDEQKETVSALYSLWKEKKDHLASLNTDVAQRSQRIDFLTFQITELEEAALSSPTEDEELEKELHALNHSEALYNFSAEAEAAIYGGTSESGLPMLDQTGSLLNKAKSLVNFDPKLEALTENLASLKLLLEEAGYFLRQYSQSVSRDESKLDALNARAALLAKLKRKYGPSLADVIENAQKFSQELQMLENHDSSLAEAQTSLAAARMALDKAALSLSKARTKAAKEFSSAVEKELADLHMERAKFQVEFSPLAEPNANGIDSIRLLIAANPGEPLGLLSKIASGGELSRIMLAMHNVVSSHGGVGVFLFDEVDTGIGGKTAVTVGAKLQKVARNNQVICITHLPQVAAFANKQFRVEKRVVKKSGEERTVTSVLALSAEDRVLEIARMLGGSEKDKEALAAAKSMLSKASAPSKSKQASVSV